MNEPYTIGLAVAGWLATTWLAYKWGQRSQREKRAAEAHAKFRSAFSSLRISVVNGNIRRTRLTELEGEHESVITEFRIRLPRRKQSAFGDAYLKYHQCCNPEYDPKQEPGRVGDVPAGLGEFDRAMKDSLSSRQRGDLVAAIDAMVDFADKT
jgi:hypothetical protein